MHLGKISHDLCNRQSEKEAVPSLKYSIESTGICKTWSKGVRNAYNVGFKDEFLDYLC